MNAGRAWPPSQDEVLAARSGDTDSLGRILNTGYPKLVAFYRGVGLRNADAEDLASEACEGMVRNLRRLREPAAFEGWFWTVARNRLRTRLRTVNRVVYELKPGEADDPEERAMASDDHRRIRLALAQLSPRDREVLWLREVQGLEYGEISGRMGLTTGAIRVAALRARRRLEEIYGAMEDR